MSPPTEQEQRFLPGSVYFILLHEDKALTIPVVQTLIFRESRNRGDGSIEYLFREIGPRGEESIPFVVREEHADELVTNLKGLIQRLNVGVK